MEWNIIAGRPIYLQLMEQIELSILSGVYLPGDKIPSVRELALEAAVNPNTMQKALSELERTGLILSKRTSGRFITEDKEMVEKLKEEYVKEQVLKFYQNLKELGISKAEMIQYMSQITTQED